MVPSGGQPKSILTTINVITINNNNNNEDPMDQDMSRVAVVAAVNNKTTR